MNNLQVASILEEAIKHASEPEQYFFIMLDQDLETISKFYDSKEKEAEAKYEAIEMQVKIVKSFASKISKANVRMKTYEAMITYYITAVR